MNISISEQLMNCIGSECDCSLVCSFSNPEFSCSGENWDNQDTIYGACCPCHWNGAQTMHVALLGLLFFIVALQQLYRKLFCSHHECCRRTHWKEDGEPYVGEKTFHGKDLVNMEDFPGFSFPRSSPKKSYLLGFCDNPSRKSSGLPITPEEKSSSEIDHTVVENEFNIIETRLSDSEIVEEGIEVRELVRLEPSHKKDIGEFPKFSSPDISDRLIPTLRSYSLRSHNLERQCSVFETLCNSAIFVVLFPIWSIFSACQKPDTYDLELGSLPDRHQQPQVHKNSYIRSLIGKAIYPSRPTVSIDTGITSGDTLPFPCEDDATGPLSFRSRKRSVVDFFMTEMIGLHPNENVKGHRYSWKAGNPKLYGFIVIVISTLLQACVVLSILLPFVVQFEDSHYEISYTELYGPLSGYCFFVLYWFSYMAYTPKIPPVDKNLLRDRKLYFTIRMTIRQHTFAGDCHFHQELQCEEDLSKFADKIEENANYELKEFGMCTLCRDTCAWITAGFSVRWFIAMVVASIPWLMRYYVNNNLLTQHRFWKWMIFSFVANIFWLHQFFTLVMKIIRKAYKQLRISQDVTNIMGLQVCHIEDCKKEVQHCQYHLDCKQPHNLVSWIILRHYIFTKGRVNAAQLELWISMLIIGTVSVTAGLFLSLTQGSGMRVQSDVWDRKVYAFNQAVWVASAVAIVLWCNIFVLLYVGRSFRSQQEREKEFLELQKAYLSFEMYKEDNLDDRSFLWLFQEVINLTRSQKLVPRFFSLSLDDGYILGFSAMGSLATALMMYLNTYLGT